MQIGSYLPAFGDNVLDPSLSVKQSKEFKDGTDRLSRNVAD